jgi:N-methylhydantoinase A
VFSAFGLLLADTEHHLSRSLRLRTDAVTVSDLQAAIDTLRHEGARRLDVDGFPAARQVLRLSAMARYVGQSSEIAVALPEGDAAAVLQALPEAFGAEHERSYGFRAPAGEPMEIVSLSLIARGVPEHARLPGQIPPARTKTPEQRRAWFDGHGWCETPVISRAGLSLTPRPGPLIVQEYDATCLVPPGCTARLDDFGNIRLDLDTGVPA